MPFLKISTPVVETEVECPSQEPFVHNTEFRYWQFFCPVRDHKQLTKHNSNAGVPCCFPTSLKTKKQTKNQTHKGTSETTILSWLLQNVVVLQQLTFLKLFFNNLKKKNPKNFVQLYCPNRISPMGNSGCLPGESQLRQSCATQPTAHAGYF